MSGLPSLNVNRGYCRGEGKVTNVLLHGWIWAKFLVRAGYVILMSLAQLVCLWCFDCESIVFLFIWDAGFGWMSPRVKSRSRWDFELTCKKPKYARKNGAVSISLSCLWSLWEYLTWYKSLWSTVRCRGCEALSRLACCVARRTIMSWGLWWFGSLNPRWRWSEPTAERYTFLVGVERLWLNATAN